ncbi:MAG: energy transducer TonB [Acidobacteriota bacterium]|nr:energy transducer TonB [Acidobacteriota bacterium]MDE3169911.1 energy transducer TonB [Acidobacteriota bacterium]
MLVPALLCLALLASAPRLSAQWPDLGAAAAQLGHAIDHSKCRTVAVLDLAGPGDKVTGLGAALSNGLSTAMSKEDPTLQVIDRAHIAVARLANDYPPTIVIDHGSAMMFGQELGADAVITGSVSVSKGKTLHIQLDAYRVGVDKDRRIAVQHLTAPMSTDMAEIAAKQLRLDADTPPAIKSYFPVNSPGFTLPRCLSCPSAAYTEQALHRRVQGVVKLMAVVSTDGRISKAAVLEGLPGGLTAQAINVARQWRLTPAKTPDGKPIAARQIIEPQFEVY